MKKGLSRYIFWLICSSFPFLLFSLKFVEQTRLFAKFARNWLAAPRALHLQHDAMRSSFMIFPPFYRWENWGLENTCLAQTSITKEVAEPKPPVFHPEKKKKWNLILRAPSSVPGTYWTVKRAASGQPVNTDSTDPANHEVNLSLPRSLLLFLLFVTLQGLWDLSSLARMRSAPPTLEAWSP